jgi:hypothetical protein
MYTVKPGLFVFVRSPEKNDGYGKTIDEEAYVK